VAHSQTVAKLEPWGRALSSAVLHFLVMVLSVGAQSLVALHFKLYVRAGWPLEARTQPSERALCVILPL